MGRLRLMDGTAFDSRAYRDTMGQFCTGVAIVTGNDTGDLVGFAAQSFVSLSLEPPLIAVCPAKTSTSWPRIRSLGNFAVNVLAADQQAVSDTFAQAGKAAEMGWSIQATGAPILDGALAYVECAVAAEHDAGDHTIVVGSVKGFDILRPEARPLLYFRGGYSVEPGTE